MNMKDAVVSVLTNWNNYRDRACRSEFWYFTLAALLISLIISIIEIATGMVDIESDEWKIIYIATGMLESGSDELGILSFIYSLLLLPPSISVTARRLHDRGCSGWWQLLYLTIIGTLVITVLTVLPATEDENKWGRNPLK